MGGFFTLRMLILMAIVGGISVIGCTLGPVIKEKQRERIKKRNEEMRSQLSEEEYAELRQKTERIVHGKKR